MVLAVYPGQGSQQPGMGRFLWDNFKEARETYQEASDTLGFALEKMCFDGPESDLVLTENTQPALNATSVATERVLRSHFGVQISVAAGHSIGEYAAFVGAGVFSFPDSIRAVRIRGQAMQAAVPKGVGAMAAVMGLEPQQIENLCHFVSNSGKFGQVSPANYNAPGQIVISGHATAVTALGQVDLAEVFGPDAPKRMKLIPLQVSAPFHCALMAPAEQKMREVLGGIKFADAQYPILQNFTAQAESQAASLRENLIRQVSGSVRWQQSLAFAAEQGWLLAVEMGHGKVLQGLLKKIDPRFEVLGTNSLDDLKALERRLHAKGGSQ